MSEKRRPSLFSPLDFFKGRQSFFFSLLLAFIFFSCQERESSPPPPPSPPLPETKPPPSPPPPPARIVIMAAGDVIMHRKCLRSAAQRSKGEENNLGFDELFPGLAEVLKPADLALANLEFPVVTKPMASRMFIFYGPPLVLRALKRAGFMLLSGANNHAFDQGRQSPGQTAFHCQAESIICLGVGETASQARKPYLVTIKDVKLAVVAYTLVSNGAPNPRDPELPAVNGYQVKDLVEQVRSARELSEGVIVSVHWGEEYRRQPSKAQRALARELVANGAVLVLGHHPHVLQEIEPISTPDGRLALVAYSLGNLLSNQAPGSPTATTRLAALLRVNLEKTSGGLSVVSWDSLATWTQNRYLREKGKVVEDVHVELCPLRLQELNQELAVATDPRKKANLLQLIQFYQKREEACEQALIHPRRGQDSVPAQEAGGK